MKSTQAFKFMFAAALCLSVLAQTPAVRASDAQGGAIIGALLGGAFGGHKTGDRVAGAIVGGIGGAIVGSMMDNADRERQQESINRAMEERSERREWYGRGEHGYTTYIGEEGRYVNDPSAVCHSFSTTVVYENGRQGYTRRGWSCRDAYGRTSVVEESMVRRGEYYGEREYRRPHMFRCEHSAYNYRDIVLMDLDTGYPVGTFYSFRACERARY
jgi:surface antigen